MEDTLVRPVPDPINQQVTENARLLSELNKAAYAAPLEVKAT